MFTVDELIVHLQSLSDDGLGSFTVRFEGGGAAERHEFGAEDIRVNSRKEVIEFEQPIY